MHALRPTRALSPSKQSITLSSRRLRNGDGTAQTVVIESSTTYLNGYRELRGTVYARHDTINTASIPRDQSAIALQMQRRLETGRHEPTLDYKQNAAGCYYYAPGTAKELRTPAFLD